MSSLSWLLVVFVSCTLMICITCQATNNQDDLLYDNGKLLNPPYLHQIKRPFFGGSRYGRSSQRYNKDLSSAPVIVSRNDRFFLGSRYGKRSQELYPEALDDQQPSSSTSSAIFMNEQNNKQLSCVYVGYSNFYRCDNNNEKPFNNSNEE